MPSLKDELFGKLHCVNGFWRGKTKIKMFGLEREITLTVDGSQSADFSAVQREAYIHFLRHMKSITDQAEERIFDYYIENFEEYRESLGAEANKAVQKVDHISELKSFVIPTELIVRRVRSNGIRRLGLLCDASWDIENGVGIKIENEFIKEVGYQDVVL